MVNFVRVFCFVYWILEKIGCCKEREKGGIILKIDFVRECLLLIEIEIVVVCSEMKDIWD